MVTPESVKAGIQGGLACEHVEVLGDGQHFQALIVSGEFTDAARQRHRCVRRAGERMREESTRFPCAATPDEWKQGG